jgi:hypothetical protein
MASNNFFLYKPPPIYFCNTSGTCVELYCLYETNLFLKGQSHEKVGEMRVEGDSLGPN